MADSLARVLAVARLTAREAVRRRVILVALVMSAAYLALYGLGLSYAATSVVRAGGPGMDELLRRAAAAQMLYVGLFPAGFIVALTAVFASVGTISSELDTGVLYAVLARPVRRAEVVAGKWLGLSVMLAAYSVVLNGVVVLLARTILGAPVTQWPAALAIMALEPLVLVSLAVLGSSRLPTLANGVLCGAAYGIGFIGGLIEQLGGLLKNATMIDLGILSSLVVPLDALQRKAVSFVMPQGLLFSSGASGIGIGENTTPSGWMLVYGMGWIVLVAVIAARTFSKRDL